MAADGHLGRSGPVGRRAHGISGGDQARGEVQLVERGLELTVAAFEPHGAHGDGEGLGIGHAEDATARRASGSDAAWRAPPCQPPLVRLLGVSRIGRRIVGRKLGRRTRRFAALTKRGDKTRSAARRAARRSPFTLGLTPSVALRVTRCPATPTLRAKADMPQSPALGPGASGATVLRWPSA